LQMHAIFGALIATPTMDSTTLHLR